MAGWDTNKVNAGEIVRMLRASPFHPFRIQMVGGEQIDVRHPEMAIVTPTHVVVGIPRPEGGIVAKDIMYLAISDVERIVEIEPSSTT